MARDVALKKIFGFTGNTQVRRLSGATALILGEDVSGLERQMCALTGTPFCVHMPDAELGLYLALQACGVEQGDRVLCSGLAPAYVIQAILWAGAVPVLVDINPNTFNLDPYCLEYAVKKCKRTAQPGPKVLIASDAFGLPCNYAALVEICNQYEISLIEDMGESLGAGIGTRRTGSFGRFSIASFAGAGEESVGEEGAAVLAHGEEDMAALRHLLKAYNDQAGDYIDIACHASVRAGIALERLEELTKQLGQRQVIAREYRAHLEGYLRLQAVPQGYRSAYNRFAVMLQDAQARERIAARLREEKISYWMPRPLVAQHACEDWERVMLRNTCQAHEKLLLLPAQSHLTRRVVAYIAQLVMDAMLEESPRELCLVKA